MQSKISFCNGPVFRKNLSRFAPAWGLYTLALLLAFFLMGDSGLEYWFSANIATSMGFMGIVNLGYGALTAMLLFGDLTNPKLCNGLHALPLRRETWFFTNAVSGIFFNLIPTVIAVIPAVVASTFSAMESGWQIPLYWLAAVNLEYVFFFGLAVLCMFLSGSRIGAAVIYGIVNFLAVLAFYAAEIIYVPHLPGVVAQLDGFLPFCPVAQLADMTFVDTENIKEFLRYNLDGSEIYQLNGTFTLSGDWWYLGVIAGASALPGAVPEAEAGMRRGSDGHQNSGNPLPGAVQRYRKRPAAAWLCGLHRLRVLRLHHTAVGRPCHRLVCGSDAP